MCLRLARRDYLRASVVYGPGVVVINYTNLPRYKKSHLETKVH